MSFPNVSDILATTIESRSRKLADNVTNNNVLLSRLNSKGKIKNGARRLREFDRSISFIIHNTSDLS